MEGNFSWVSVPNDTNTVTGEKRNRNPNWTDEEIVRFLNILMEDNSLKDLNAHRTKQVFCYVSQVMRLEGSEKTWDQCKVKLKNLKSQWKYVKDRVPSIEEADMNDENVVRQLMSECQTNGVSPGCIKHLRLLQQFLASLEAARGGVSPPRFNHDINVKGIEVQMFQEKSTPHVRIPQDDYEDPEASLFVETDISPSSSPVRLRVMTPGDINNGGIKRKTEEDNESVQAKRPKINDAIDDSDNLNGENLATSAILQKFQKEMMDKFLQFQRESESRFLSWEQERWRMEQSMLDRWRNEQRVHEKEMFSVFCNLLSQCNQSISDNTS